MNIFLPPLYSTRSVEGRGVGSANDVSCCRGAGYAGARCEVNVNECEEDRAVCGHGVCYDTYGGFVCACQPGYTGERCHKVRGGARARARGAGAADRATAQMSACAMGPCGVGGACVEEAGGGGFRCVCAKGWAPPLCAAPLASSTPHPPHAAHAHAHAGASCADLACPPHAHCRDSGGCPPSAASAPPAPARCTHSLLAAGVPSMVAGVVISKQVTCVCDPGYYGTYRPPRPSLWSAARANGVRCAGAPGPAPNCSTLENACEAGVCLNGATCSLANDRFNCTCAPGYKGTLRPRGAPSGSFTL